MKKSFIAIAIAVLLVVSVSGCIIVSSPNFTTNTTTPTPTPTYLPPPTPTPTPRPPTPTPSPLPSPSPKPSPTPVPVGSYLFLGPKWSVSKYPHGVPYVINPKNAWVFELNESAVVSAIKNSFETWNIAVGFELFNRTPTIDRNATSGSDDRNVVTWEVVNEYNALAITKYWGTENGEMLECDLVFNINVKWGIDADGEGLNYRLYGETYDIQSVSTHEAGHWAGLADIYNSAFASVTMFWQCDAGATYFLSLTSSDTTGVRLLYGA